MSDSQFNEKTSQAVNDAIATKSVGQNSQPGLPAALRTAQGGDTISPAGATPESLSAPAQGQHGALATSYNIERTIQGSQDLEVLAEDQKEARVGGTGPYVNSNGVGNQDVTGTSIAYTVLDNQRLNNVYIPNVGNRFSR